MAALQKSIFERISNNDILRLQQLLIHENVVPDVHDEFGMTPLQLASYKGNKEIVELLLNFGADVNWEKQGNGYTALHYAALSGNAEVCHILLNAGAKRHAINAVGCSVSEVASLIDNQACVAAINNYIPRTAIDLYTISLHTQIKPSLPANAAEAFHKFVNMINIHPVHVLLHLRRSPVLTLYLNKVQQTLELMRDREMKKSSQINEVLVFKFHYLVTVLTELIHMTKKLLLDPKGKPGNEEINTLDVFHVLAKKFLKRCPELNSIPSFQDSFLRECVRHFPYRKCAIFGVMVAAMSKADCPNALNIVAATINGRRFLKGESAVYCSTCDETGTTKKCSGCKSVSYCDRECQSLHWFVHKRECESLKKYVKKEQ